MELLWDDDMGRWALLSALAEAKEGGVRSGETGRESDGGEARRRHTHKRMREIWVYV